MINPIYMKVFQTENENSNPNIYSSTSLFDEYKVHNYQTLNSFYPKKTIKKKYSSFLTDNDYPFKKSKFSLPSLEIIQSNNSIYNPNTYSFGNNKEFTSNECNNHKSNTLKHHHSLRNFNISNSLFEAGTLDEKKCNLSFIATSDYNNNEIFPDIINSNVQNEISNITFPHILENDILLPRQTINQYKNTNSNSNYNNDFFSNENTSNNFNLTNNDLNSSFISSTSLDNITQNLENFGEEEPNSNFKLSEFVILNEIGKGSEGSIYAVNWKRNNKNYALKKCEIIFDEEAKKKTQDSKTIKEFIQSTGCEGIIKIYGSLSSKNKFGTNYFYELMELAEKTWEKEILARGKNKFYYQEYELMNIFAHLIKTFSALQSIHFTHRDINPQNIMKIKGKLKICDFGNSKILKRDGVIIQKIRGSEIFMSPIVFKGYHSGVKTIKHNSFKSDVFSLGMCFFLAASLNYDALNAIREIYDMNIIKKFLNKYLGKRYSQNLINLLLNMLQIDERRRPDFKDLELLLP